MTRVNPIVTTICSVCNGRRAVRGLACKSCKATGYIHRELVFTKSKYDDK